MLGVHSSLLCPVTTLVPSPYSPRLRNEALPPCSTPLTLQADLNAQQLASIAQQLTVLDWDLTAGINVDQLRQEVGTAIHAAPHTPLSAAPNQPTDALSACWKQCGAWCLILFSCRLSQSCP